MNKYITITWSSDDVRQQADEDGIKLTDIQVNEILETLKNEHDATIGINWDVISNHIRDRNSK